jgi:excisionase family DNA binding protein
MLARAASRDSQNQLCGAHPSLERTFFNLRQVVTSRAMARKQMNQTHEPSILTVREAADLLRVSERSLVRWRAQGLLPTMSLNGRRVRFRRSDVLALLSPGVRPSMFGRADVQP